MMLQVNKKQAYQCYLSHINIYAVPGYMDIKDAYDSESLIMNHEILHRQYGGKFGLSDIEIQELLEKNFISRCNYIKKHSYDMPYGGQKASRLKFYVNVENITN